MNPLKRQQQELLERIGCSDLARKVDELVREFNKIEKPTETNVRSDAIAHQIYNADTFYDAEQILKDYIKKLKS